MFLTTSPNIKKGVALLECMFFCSAKSIPNCYIAYSILTVIEFRFLWYINHCSVINIYRLIYDYP